MLRRYALVMGIVFLLIGVLGFFDPMTPDGRLLGLFAVNPAHNIVHILTGLLGLWAANVDEPRASLVFTWYLLISYGLITVLGFTLTPDSGMLFNVIHNNRADNWLHLLLTLSAVAALMASQRRPVFR